MVVDSNVGVSDHLHGSTVVSMAVDGTHASSVAVRLYVITADGCANVGNVVVGHSVTMAANDTIANYVAVPRYVSMVANVTNAGNAEVLPFVNMVDSVTSANNAVVHPFVVMAGADTDARIVRACLRFPGVKMDQTGALGIQKLMSYCR